MINKQDVYGIISDFVRPDPIAMTTSRMYLKQYLQSKFKSQFGREFFLFDRISSSITKDTFRPLLSFFSNNIVDFEDRYIDANGYIKPFILEKLSPQTYILILCDIFIPNRAISNAVKGNTGASSIYDADTYIYIFGKHSLKFSRMLDRAIQEVENNKQERKIAIVHRLDDNVTDVSTLTFDKREAKTLVYSNDELIKIENHIDKWIQNSEFYKSKQLLYKTGILLYGVPGTGKSTICKVIANLYNRNIIQVSIPTINSINFSELSRLINNDSAEYIVLLEDIDTLYLNRDDKNHNDKDYNSIINNLLQFLDSNSSPNNVIFMATTNHIDRLDEALLRAGRFDLHVEIQGILSEDLGQMLDLFDIDRSLTKEILEEYWYKYGYDKYLNQSKLQSILLDHVKVNHLKETDPEGFISDNE